MLYIYIYYIHIGMYTARFLMRFACWMSNIYFFLFRPRFATPIWEMRTAIMYVCVSKSHLKSVRIKNASCPCWLYLLSFVCILLVRIGNIGLQKLLKFFRKTKEILLDTRFLYAKEPTRITTPLKAVNNSISITERICFLLFIRG